MARRPGGYKRSDPTEWAECARSMYGEAITSANQLGQDVYVWMNDAIAHHVYRIKVMQAQERYLEAKQEAEHTRNPYPDQSQFMPKEPPPTITRPGQGSTATGRSYRP